VLAGVSSEDLRRLRRVAGPLPEGIPSEGEYIRIYSQRRGIHPPDAQQWAFHRALALFRLAGILAGVYTRSLQGNASAGNARRISLPGVVGRIADLALELAAAPHTSPPLSIGFREQVR
jgi:aminoglycoside phosphotransferase (APT) family kinase protein